MRNKKKLIHDIYSLAMPAKEAVKQGSLDKETLLRIIDLLVEIGVKAVSNLSPEEIASIPEEEIEEKIEEIYGDQDFGLSPEEKRAVYLFHLSCN